MTNLNEAEILELIRATASPRDGDGFTRQELQDLIECGKDKALRIIKQLVKSGKAKPVVVDRVNLHGYQNKVKGYRLTPVDDLL